MEIREDIKQEFQSYYKHFNDDYSVIEKYLDKAITKALNNQEHRNKLKEEEQSTINRFSSMSTKERTTLKQNNPSLYNKAKRGIN
ncbi:hypothetical protein [Granulicatella adiacens]|uniref:hypothetical protein n=1 Tax=Granulicatella adiacens TaxID=46124 RepID=UPI00241EF206|nr:hypothetical protein [Granulicatella adiacens]